MLMKHCQCLQVMQGKHSDRDTFHALVRVVPEGTDLSPPALFVWTITRQSCPELMNCWMTDSVQACSTAFTWVMPDDLGGKA